MNKLSEVSRFTWTIVAALGVSLPGLAHAEQLVEINRLVAQVEDKVITQGELDRVLNLLNLSGEEKKNRSQEFIENKIENLLVIKEFKSTGRFIPESYIEGEYNKRLIRDFDNDRKLFRDYLKSKSQTQLDFRRDLENDIIISSMYAKFRRGQADVSPDRVEEFYRSNKDLFRVDSKVKLREIKLAPLAGEPKDVLMQQAVALHKQLKEGIAFAELARAHGQSPLKAQGGDWGALVSKEEIANELMREKAFALKQGEFSDPFTIEETRQDKDGKSIKTGKFSIYLLHADQVQVAGTKPLDEVRLKVEQLVAQDMDRQAKSRWVARLRRGAYVKYFEDDTEK